MWSPWAAQCNAEFWLEPGFCDVNEKVIRERVISSFGYFQNLTVHSIKSCPCSENRQHHQWTHCKSQLNEQSPSTVFAERAQTVGRRSGTSQAGSQFLRVLQPELCLLNNTANLKPRNSWPRYEFSNTQRMNRRRGFSFFLLSWKRAGLLLWPCGVV